MHDDAMPTTREVVSKRFRAIWAVTGFAGTLMSMGVTEDDRDIVEQIVQAHAKSIRDEMAQSFLENTVPEPFQLLSTALDLPAEIAKLLTDCTAEVEQLSPVIVDQVMAQITLLTQFKKAIQKKKYLQVDQTTS